MLSAVTQVGNALLTAHKEKEARKEQHEYGEKAAAAADLRTRQLYNDLYSPSAQMKQLKEAGLSPSIYASGGLAGSSGQSGAQGNGTNQQASAINIDPLAASQIALNESQARKNNAEAATEEETGIKLNTAEIQKMYSEVGLNEAAKGYKEVETELQKLELDFQEQDFGNRLDRAKSNTQIVLNNAYKTYYDWQDKKLQFTFNKKTYESRVKEQEKKVLLMVEKIFSERQGRKLTAAETQYYKQSAQSIYYNMQMLYAKYGQDERKLALEIAEFVHKQKMDVLNYNLNNRVRTHEYMQGWTKMALDTLLNYMQANLMHCYNGSITPVGTITNPPVFQ